MSNITVTELQGHTSGGDANTVKVKSGHTLAAQSNATVGGTLGVTGTTTTAQINASGSINTTANTISVTNSSFPQLQLNSGVKNYHIFNDTGSNSLYFKNNTDNVNGMIMDSSGRVTKPKQPYCALYRNADFTTTSVIPFIYNATISDAYSMGDTTQGRITAPVDGHYLINAQIGYYMNGDARQTILAVRRNGNNVRRSDGTVEDLQGNNGHMENSLSFVLYMSANDYIDVTFGSTAAVTVHVPDFSCYLEIYKLG